MHILCYHDHKLVFLELANDRKENSLSELIESLSWLVKQDYLRFSQSGKSKLQQLLVSKGKLSDDRILRVLKVESGELALDNILIVLDVMEKAEELQVVIDTDLLKQDRNLWAVTNQVMANR